MAEGVRLSERIISTPRSVSPEAQAFLALDHPPMPSLPALEDKAAWRARQVRQRSYDADVVRVVEGLRSRFEVVEYGRLDYGADTYPLFALKSRHWREELPVALVTGGVHGYETSGVHGALQFLEDRASGYEGSANLIVAPCISPWAYERIHRWLGAEWICEQQYRPSYGT